MFVERVEARGHPLIKATHPTTFEVTRDDWLTPRGDCIIGVLADKAPADLDAGFRRALMRDGAMLLVLLVAGDAHDVVEARGCGSLLMTSRSSIVIRKSRYVDPRTLAVESSKAARDLDRGLVRNLQRGATLTMHLLVFDAGERHLASAYAARALGLPPR